MGGDIPLISLLVFLCVPGSAKKLSPRKQRGSWRLRVRLSLSSIAWSDTYRVSDFSCAPPRFITIASHNSSSLTAIACFLVSWVASVLESFYGTHLTPSVLSFELRYHALRCNFLERLPRVFSVPASVSSEHSDMHTCIDPTDIQTSRFREFQTGLERPTCRYHDTVVEQERRVGGTRTKSGWETEVAFICLPQVNSL